MSTVAGQEVKVTARRGDTLARQRQLLTTFARSRALYAWLTQSRGSAGEEVREKGGNMQEAEQELRQSCEG